MIRLCLTAWLVTRESLTKSEIPGLPYFRNIFTLISIITPSILKMPENKLSFITMLMISSNATFLWVSLIDNIFRVRWCFLGSFLSEKSNHRVLYSKKEIKQPWHPTRTMFSKLEVIKSGFWKVQSRLETAFTRAEQQVWRLLRKLVTRGEKNSVLKFGGNSLIFGLTFEFLHHFEK